MELAEVVAAVDELGATERRGNSYRHIETGRDPLSGEGARRVGGRWNPPKSFAVLYLATDVPTAINEFVRFASKQGLQPDAFLPRAR